VSSSDTSSRGSRAGRGKLFVITGPSGVGKGTLIRRLREAVPGIDLSVSATTRAPREGERDAEDYHFMKPEEFDGFVRDTVNFLDYAGDPSQAQRRGIGIWVVLFLLVFTAFAWFLKKEYWKDVH